MKKINTEFRLPVFFFKVSYVFSFSFGRGNSSNFVVVFIESGLTYSLCIELPHSAARGSDNAYLHGLPVYGLKRNHFADVCLVQKCLLCGQILTHHGGCKTVKLPSPALLFIRRLLFWTPLILSRCRQFREFLKSVIMVKKN